MKDSQPQAIYLKDYQAPHFLIEKTDLIFSLEENQTTVTSTLLVKRNPNAGHLDTPLVLHGENLILTSLKL